MDGLLFRPINSLYFTTPQTGAAGQIDGYSPANRQVFSLNNFAFQESETWGVGDTLYFRWYNPRGSAGSEGIGIGIDDIFFNAIPEPHLSILLPLFGLFFSWSQGRKTRRAIFD
ncbi:MAG: hypothetical protein ACK5LK_02705 [Chthoniobacterales bacterium]